MQRPNFQSNQTLQVLVVLNLLGFMNSACSDDVREDIDQIGAEMGMEAPEPDTPEETEMGAEVPRPDMPHGAEMGVEALDPDMPDSSASRPEECSGQHFTHEGQDFCMPRGELECPEGYTYRVDVDMALDIFWSFCSDKEIDQTPEELREMFVDICASASSEEECWETERCYFVRSERLYSYDEETGSCEARNEGECLVYIEEDNVQYCWVNKRMDGSLEVRLDGKYSVGWTQLDTSDPRCQACMEP